MSEMENLIIQEMLPDAVKDVLTVERETFETDEEARLVRDLFKDPSAKPYLSLVAYQSERAVGHCLFTRAILDPLIAVKASILGPLAVIPDCQKQGIGGKLIQAGVQILKGRGINWVFVLGHSSYYPRFGFSSALEQGFEPPYSIPGDTSPWMAMALSPICLVRYQGRVIPADTFNYPRYWGG